MKLSIAICVFALFLGACYAETYTYDPVAPSDYSKHPLIQGLRDTGINFIVNQAYNKGDTKTKNFVLAHTNSLGFRRAEGTSGNKFYQYNVSLVNENNKNETIVARFLVRYNCATEEQVVISWKYKYDIHSWVEIPLCPACSGNEPQPEPQPEEECVEAPVEEAPFEEAPVEEAPVEEEEEEVVEEIVEEVIYEEEIVEEVVEEVAEEVAEEVEIIEEAEEAEDIEELEQEEQLEQEEATVPTPTPEPVKNTTTETGTIVYPWILLPSEVYDSDFHTDNAAYGMNYLVNQEVARGNLTAGTWKVSVVNEIYEQTLPDVINYRYHMYADRAEDTWIYNFTFSVKIIKASGRRSIGFYRFQTLDANGNNISIGTLPELAPVKNATQNYTTVIVDGKPVNTTTGTIITGK